MNKGPEMDCFQGTQGVELFLNIINNDEKVVILVFMVGRYLQRVYSSHRTCHKNVCKRLKKNYVPIHILV